MLLFCARASAEDTVRIRRELRTLSIEQRNDLVAAMWTMKTTSNDEGKRAFGDSFWSYDYFTIKHAVAVSDPRGDQGHFGPCFMTYHRAFLLEFEAALVSVLRARNSTLDALPYWDAHLDADTGPLFGTSESVFTSTWFGSYTGNSSEQYSVTDGMFARWPIGPFNEEFIPTALRGNVTAIYSGSPVGLLRGSNNMINTSFTTRFPKNFPTLGVHSDLAYTMEDMALCEDPRAIPDWMAWQACLENAVVSGRARHPGMFWNNKSGLHWMHSQMHTRIGSYLPPWPQDFPFMDKSTKMWMGDMMDVATSPNDVLFAFHHANADRINVAWQEATESKFDEATVQSWLWGYPTDHESWRQNWTERDLPEFVWSSAVDGCLLDDVISSSFPFESLGNMHPKGKVFTHRDLLEQTTPAKLTYAYDSSTPRSRMGSTVLV